MNCAIFDTTKEYFVNYNIQRVEHTYNENILMYYNINNLVHLNNVTIDQLKIYMNEYLNQKVKLVKWQRKINLNEIMEFVRKNVIKLVEK